MRLDAKNSKPIRDFENWVKDQLDGIHKEVPKEQSMSDTLQEREDQIMEEEANEREIRRIRRARLAAKESPQTNQHQVTQSGTCVIPGCPCRGWSAQETAGADDDKPHCTCGSWLHAHQNDTGKCLWPNCGCQKFEPAVEHQPAARGGGDGPERIWVEIYRQGYPIPSEFYTSKIPHSIEYIRADQHQSLVAERERLLTTLKLVVASYVRSDDYGIAAQTARDTLAAIQQRSTPV